MKKSHGRLLSLLILVSIVSTLLVTRSPASARTVVWGDVPGPVPTAQPPIANTKPTSTPTAEPYNTPTITPTPNPPPNTKNQPTIYIPDVLQYTDPAGGSQVFARHISSCSPGLYGCAPDKMWGPYQASGYNAGGVLYQSTNIYYNIKPDYPWNGHGDQYFSFEKFGYDGSHIWLMRDDAWGQGGSMGNDTSGTFPTTAQGMCDPNGTTPQQFNIPAGTVSTGYWANRSMSVGDYVDVPGWPNHIIPAYSRTFNRNYTDGTGIPTAESYPWTYTMRLLDAGDAAHGNQMYFGNAVGSRDWIVLQRRWDYHRCWSNNPGLEERYYYAKDVGWVGFEAWQFNSDGSETRLSTQFWGNSESSTATVADLPAASPPIDTAYDHVFVNFASQMASTRAQLFFATSAEDSFSEDKSAIVTANNDGNWYTYDFNFSGNPKWKGTITRVRFDPTDSPGAAGWYSACGCLGWQRIRIGNETKSSFVAYFDIGSNGDTQGFSLFNLNNWGWVYDSRDAKWKWLAQPNAQDPQISRTNLGVSIGR